MSIEFLKFFKIRGKDLAKLRVQSGLSQERLAALMYGDKNKRYRIIKIEKEEMTPGLWEAIAWFKECSQGEHHEEMNDAVSNLERVIKNRVKKTKGT